MSKKNFSNWAELISLGNAQVQFQHRGEVLYASTYTQGISCLVFVLLIGYIILNIFWWWNEIYFMVEVSNSYIERTEDMSNENFFESLHLMINFFTIEALYYRQYQNDTEDFMHLEVGMDCDYNLNTPKNEPMYGNDAFIGKAHNFANCKTNCSHAEGDFRFSKHPNACKKRSTKQQPLMGMIAMSTTSAVDCWTGQLTLDIVESIPSQIKEGYSEANRTFTFVPTIEGMKGIVFILNEISITKYSKWSTWFIEEKLTKYQIEDFHVATYNSWHFNNYLDQRYLSKTMGTSDQLQCFMVFSFYRSDQEIKVEITPYNLFQLCSDIGGFYSVLFSCTVLLFFFNQYRLSQKFPPIDADGLSKYDHDKFEENDKKVEELTEKLSKVLKLVDLQNEQIISQEQQLKDLRGNVTNLEQKPDQIMVQKFLIPG